MRIGYLLNVNAGTFDQPLPDPHEARETMTAMIEEGILAEQHGFHAVTVPHRHGRTECYLPGPEQLLTVLARETSRVALGTYTFVATLYHPMKALEQFAVIDTLSGGRLFTTMSRGYHVGYWRQFGIPEEHLLGRFQEALAITQLAFAGDRFSFDGKYWQVKEGLLTPGPYQQGGWPIWGGGNASDAAIARCADYAVTWTCDPFPLLKEVWDQQVGQYRRAARERGKTPFVVLMRNGWVADDYETAVREFGDHYTYELDFYQRRGLLRHHPDFASGAITAEATRPHLVVGNRDECIARIEEYERDFGVDYVIMNFRMMSGPRRESVREQIQRFGDEVCAYFNARTPAPDHPAIPSACRW